MTSRNKKLALGLLREIINEAKMQDAENKYNSVNIKASQTIGESWMVFHLKALEELLMEDTKK